VGRSSRPRDETAGPRSRWDVWVGITGPPEGGPFRFCLIWKGWAGEEGGRAWSAKREQQILSEDDRKKSKGNSKGNGKKKSKGNSKGNSKKKSKGNSKGNSRKKSKGNSKKKSKGNSKNNSKGNSRGSVGQWFYFVDRVTGWRWSKFMMALRTRG